MSRHVVSRIPLFAGLLVIVGVLVFMAWRGHHRLQAGASAGEAATVAAVVADPSLRHEAQDGERARPGRSLPSLPASEPAAPLPAPTAPPARRPPPVTPGLSAQSRELWLAETSTQSDIDLAYALDVCACASVDCVRGLQAAYYARRTRAPGSEPSTDEGAAVRQMRAECLLRLSRAAYAARAR
jgi:hypothetical protein